MSTVKEKPKSQARIDRERAARKGYSERKKAERQAAKDATILSRAAAATKTPAPPKRPSVAPVPSPDSQQIGGLRAEIEQLQAEIKRLGGVIFSQNEHYAKLIEEKAAIEKIHKSNMDFLKANHGQWMLIQWEEDL